MNVTNFAMHTLEILNDSEKILCTHNYSSSLTARENIDGDKPHHFYLKNCALTLISPVQAHLSNY